MDTIELIDKNGNKNNYEVCLLCNKNNKHYIVYRSLDGKEYYASYYKIKDGVILPELYNDLTNEEYKMLEKLYRKGALENV